MSNSDFNTPPDFLDLVRKLDPKRGIGLDPCSNESSMVDSRYSYDIETDGLSRIWRYKGLVFMNPPHSMAPNNIEPWIDHFIGEFSSSGGDADQFVGLVPAKIGPKWAQKVLPFCDARCFLAGRIKYWQNGAPMPGPGKFDSLVLYKGHNPDLFHLTFDDYGWCI